MISMLIIWLCVQITAALVNETNGSTIKACECHHRKPQINQNSCQKFQSLTGKIPGQALNLPRNLICM